MHMTSSLWRFCIDFISSYPESRWTYPFYFKAMIEWPFLFPFAALSENFAYSTFCFLWVWFQFWFWPKFKRERSISKLRFKTFFIERKTSSLFHFSSTCTCTLSHKLFLKCEKVIWIPYSTATPLGNIIFIGFDSI